MVSKLNFVENKLKMTYFLKILLKFGSEFRSYLQIVINVFQNVKAFT